MRAIDHGFECIGIKEGWKGLVENITCPLNEEAVDEIFNKGGTILKTSRTNPFKKDGAVDKCIDNVKQLGLNAVVTMGGEDTLGVASRLYKEHQIPTVGIPKTMDNDLSGTDFTFGFDTSVSVAMDAAERLVDTGRSHKRIMILEVMGRHTGWVALYTGIAAGADWILLPEKKVDGEKMCGRLMKAHARRGVALVVASEAISLPGMDGEKEDLDEFGHMLLKKRGIGERLSSYIEMKTGIETRSAVIGHIQRGGPPSLFDRILGMRFGVKAADLVKEGNFGKMVALRGNDIISVSLEESTSTLKTVPQEWIDFMEIFFR